jgi:hypothetical protein
MPPCDNLVIWRPVPNGSRFCASASGTIDDFLVGVRMIGADGSETQFLNADLVPGPAHRSLTDQGYAARVSLTPGSTSPIVTFDAWIEDPTGARVFECTWSATGAFKVTRITLVIQP